MTTETNRHYFAASATTWATTTPERDLRQLLKLMDKERLAYNLFIVPLPYDTPYEVNFYQPQVEGTMHLETFTFKRGEKK
jgi:hypothetical protein